MHIVYEVTFLLVGLILFATTNTAADCPVSKHRSAYTRYQFGHSSSLSISVQEGSEDAFSENKFYPQECQPKIECQNIERYYRPDGSCNNLLDGRRGMAGQPHKRLVPASFQNTDYEKSLPRARQDGSPLPSARLISTTMREEVTKESPDKAHFLIIWGQFVAHDITDTPVIEGADCSCGTADSRCFNIEVPDDDVFVVQQNETCLPLVRSEPVPDADCNTTVRQTKNNLTPYLDASNVYGSSESQLQELLDPESEMGELKILDLPSNSSLSPVLPDVTQVSCPFREEVPCPEALRPEHVECLFGGDLRANENPGLASVHTLMLRLHNKLVEDLSNINPQWNSTKLFNTARMIVSAISQRATYLRFLPEFVGKLYMERFGLTLTEQGYWHGYDSTYDATTSNSFVTAALRVGHTSISSRLSRLSPSYDIKASSLQLRDTFFNPTSLLKIEDGGSNSILRGLTKDPAQIMDTTFVTDLQNFLFREPERLGMDLLSLNLQRGRDHGVPGYNEFRAFCGMKRASTFSDFKEISVSRRRRLQRLYNNNVDDVDLYIAGISESPVKGGLIGPTFACIISYQFRDLKKGDRLWHENRGVFTPAQLQAIRQFSMPRLLCDNIPDMQSVQPNPFLQTSVIGNSRQPCENFSKLDLEPWKDESCDETSLSDSESHEFTAWFPLGEHNSYTLLSHLLVSRSEDVCRDILGSEERIVGQNKQIRFRCPPGSIRATDYPNVDASKGTWSDWENRSSPEKYYQDERRTFSTGNACYNPIAIQVFTTNGIPARQTGEVFRIFSPNAGFSCYGNDQDDGECQDYQVRYFCERLIKQNLE